MSAKVVLVTFTFCASLFKCHRHVSICLHDINLITFSEFFAGGYEIFLFGLCKGLGKPRLKRSEIRL